jgi:HlyD family secretion protein
MKLAIGLPLLGGSMVLLLWMNRHGESVMPGAMAIDRRNAVPSDSRGAFIQGIGFVEPVTEVRRLVFKVDGVIARCPAEVGRSYTKGDVLLELDGRGQIAAVSVAEAEWHSAQSERDKIESGINPHQIAAAEHKVESLKEQVRFWSKEHERYAALASRNAVSPSERDKTATEMNQRRIELRQAEADVRHLRTYVRDEDRRLADAKVEAAKARLELARQNYEDTILRAPFDGSVLELLKREGEGARLFDAEPVVVFGDVSRLRIRAEVDERFVAVLRVGREANVFGRGLGDKHHAGRVMLVKPIMGKKTVFSRAATERKDLDVVQVMIEMTDDFIAPIGLEVDVKIESSGGQ